MAAAQAAVEDLKEQRALVEGAILAEMSAMGVKTMNFEGLGKITSRTTWHYEISDIDALVLESFKKMLAALQQNRPISDGCLLQRRPHKDNLETFFAKDYPTMEPGSLEEEEALKSWGVRKATKNTLSFTKS